MVMLPEPAKVSVMAVVPPVISTKPLLKTTVLPTPLTVKVSAAVVVLVAVPPKVDVVVAVLNRVMVRLAATDTAPIAEVEVVKVLVPAAVENVEVSPQGDRHCSWPRSPPHHWYCQSWKRR